GEDRGEEANVRGARRQIELGLHGTDDFHVRREGRGGEGHARAQRRVAGAGGGGGRGGGERLAGGVEEEAPPLRLREGPGGAARDPLDLVTGSADLDLDRWL